jgi:urease gamma subunit
MYLTPTEEDRLRVFTAAELARRTLARGLQLNAPEAVALVCDAMHAAARGGASLEEVMEAGRSAVPAGQVIDGIAEIVAEIRLEVLLDEGSRLIVLHHPWGSGGADGTGVEAVEIPIDDSWMRDSGPIFVSDQRGQVAMVHFRFNAWGGKYRPWDSDAAAPAAIAAYLGMRRYHAPFVLEGARSLSTAKAPCSQRRASC